MSDATIFVTRPAMPPLEEFVPYLERIWDTGMLSNAGPLHQELETKLCAYLGVDYVSLVSNATVGLMLAIRALELSGEIITTPFSFSATTQAIEWTGLKPVFIDVEYGTGNMDPDKVEAAITKKTSALMPVHVYGNPCNELRLKEIAEEHNLLTIYDAAHAFAVRQSGASILSYGSVSVLSFHATKVFNTFEGGAVVSDSIEMKEKIDRLRNFGLQQGNHLEKNGLNGKMSEIHAAMGLLQLNYIDEMIAKRKKIAVRYTVGLNTVSGLKILHPSSDVTPNYSYYPILITEKCAKTRDDLYNILLDNGIFARKYFYPALSDLEYYKCKSKGSVSDLPNAALLSSSVLCLPIFPDLEMASVDRIIGILREYL